MGCREVGRCCMPTFSILAFIGIIVGISIVAPIASADKQYSWAGSMYNYFIFVVPLGFFLFFSCISSIYGCCMCFKTGRGCQMGLITLLCFTFGCSAFILAIAFIFPKWVLKDEGLWKRVESTANPTDLQRIIQIENDILCCGYEYADDWDKVRCATYLTNEDFMKKWLNYGIRGCKEELVNNISTLLHWISIIVGFGVFFFIFVFIFVIAVFNTQEHEQTVISTVENDKDYGNYQMYT